MGYARIVLKKACAECFWRSRVLAHVFGVVLMCGGGLVAVGASAGASAGSGPASGVSNASSPASAGDKPDKISCFVSILPQAYFVERIGGQYVDVHVMVAPGHSPATYEPTPKQLTRLANSRIYFSIGVPFEASVLSRIRRNFKTVDIVDTREGIVLIPMTGFEAETKERSAEKHTHHHSSTDPHVWLSPPLAKKIAHNIRNALVRIDSLHHETYNKNCDLLITDLDELNREITTLLAPLKGSKFYVFHPSYGYFAEAYGLVQVAVEIEGAMPGPKHLARLIDQAKADRVRTLFVQPQFSKKAAETISQAIGAEVVPLDPLARDYLRNLHDIARKISSALGHRADTSTSTDPAVESSPADRSN